MELRRFKGVKKKYSASQKLGPPKKKGFPGLKLAARLIMGHFFARLIMGQSICPVNYGTPCIYIFLKIFENRKLKILPDVNFFYLTPSCIRPPGGFLAREGRWGWELFRKNYVLCVANFFFESISSFCPWDQKNEKNKHIFLGRRNAAFEIEIRPGA